MYHFLLNKIFLNREKKKEIKTNFIKYTIKNKLYRLSKYP